MEFIITRMWYERYHRKALEIKEENGPSVLSEILEWLDENVGWSLDGCDRLYLPFYGQGWRISIKTEPPYGVKLEIDSDEMALMFLLRFGDHCGI